MDKDFRMKTLEVIIVLAIVIVALGSGLGLIQLIENFAARDKVSELQKIARDTEQIKKTTSPYEFKENLKKTTLLENFSNTVSRGKVSDTFTKVFLVKGTISQGYLYIKASVDNKSLNDNGDIYLKVFSTVGGNYLESGGILIKSKSLDTPKSGNFTELLYDLSDVKYKDSYQSSDIEVRSGDWIKLINFYGSDKGVTGFSSTILGGSIIELSLYYNCLEGESCSMVVE